MFMVKLNPYKYGIGMYSVLVKTIYKINEGLTNNYVNDIIIGLRRNIVLVVDIR